MYIHVEYNMVTEYTCTCILPLIIMIMLIRIITPPAEHFCPQSAKVDFSEGCPLREGPL